MSVHEERYANRGDSVLIGRIWLTRASELQQTILGLSGQSGLQGKSRWAT